jgi:hypothetical protein
MQYNIFFFIHYLDKSSGYLILLNCLKTYMIILLKILIYDKMNTTKHIFKILYH